MGVGHEVPVVRLNRLLLDRVGQRLGAHAVGVTGVLGVLGHVPCQIGLL